MKIKGENSSFKNFERLAKLMDSQFSIPGTRIRFGFDALIGLIPGVGDFATFIISGMMVSMLAKNGASGFVLARMVLNIVLDALIGSIPILGDIFDVEFRANERNLKLMREHYLEGRHKGSAYKVIIPLLIILLLVVGLIAWLSYKLISWLFHSL
jgi:hypothetical protein